MKWNISREPKPVDVDVDYGDQVYFGDEFPTTRLARFCIDKVAGWMREEHPMLHEAFHAHHHLFRGPVEDAARVLPVFAASALVSGVVVKKYLDSQE